MKKLRYFSGLMLVLMLSLGFSSCYMGYYNPGPRYGGPRYRNYNYRPHPGYYHHPHNHGYGHSRGWR